MQDFFWIFRGKAVQMGIHEDEEATAYIQESPRLKSKRMIILVVSDEKKDLAVETLIKANQTGKSGDGKIIITNTIDSVNVRTGDKGDAILD